MSVKIKFKQIAFPSNNKAFIKGDGTLDLSNYVILDENDKIPEEHIPDSVILKAVYYEDFINADYIPKLGETIIIIDYLKVDNKSVPSFIIGDGTTALKDLSPSGDFSKYSERAKVADDLGGREETREEQFTYQATANDESIKDGIAIVKSIKGNTVVANQLVNESGALTLISGRKYYLNIQGVKSIITATSGQVIEVNAGDVVIDITKFFNAGSVPTTAEEFERLYPNLPTEYNAGSLLNLNADSIKSVGFNAYNGEYAKVLGGMQYYLDGDIASLTFKENLEDEGEVIEIPSDNLYTPDTNGYLVATGDNICINLSHSGYRNGDYEPYKESIANLPIKKYFPDGMKSAGSVRDEIVWDESIKKYKVIQRIGSVDMGTLNWSYKNGNNNPNVYPFGYFQYVSLNPPQKRFTINMVHTTLYYNNPSNVFTRDKCILAGLERTIYIIDSSYTDAESFKQSLQGQILYYELETPIETIIDDYALIDYEVSDFGTEEIISDESTTPIVADIQYGFNAVDEIRNHRFEINKLKKSIKHGVLTIGEYKFDGSTDVTIPIYDKEYTIS